jgi:hypothetical protein
MALQFTNISAFTPVEPARGKPEENRQNMGADLLTEVAPEQEVAQDIEAPVQDTSPQISGDVAIGDAQVPLTALEEKRARIEAEVGESVASSGASAHELAAAIRDGVVCNVHIKRERFQTKTTAEEMGISHGVASQVLSGLGNKLLAPKDVLGQMNSSDTMARNLLARFGLKTPWGRFIPTGNWPMFKVAFEKQRACYFAAVDKLATMMEDGSHGVWLVEQYTAFACDRWKYIKDSYRDGDLPCDAQGQDFKDMTLPPPGFVASVVDAAVARVPDVAVVRANASFRYVLNIIQAPDTMLAAECATKDGELNRELILHMNDHKRSLIDDFLRAAHDGLVEHINGLATSVGKTLGNKATVHGKTINRILSALAEMRALNITNNEDFTSKIAELESYIQGKKSGVSGDGGISSAEVLGRLQATAAAVTESLNRDLHGAAQFSNLGV